MAVTFTEVATATGRPAASLKDHEIQQINWWINVAQSKIRSHFRKRGIPFEQLDPSDVDMVVVEAVARKVTNPKGKQNERIDDYSYGLNPEEATAQIRITDDEWDLLTPAREVGAFTIRTDLGRPRRAPGAWC